jgi:hypothetical protein
MLPPLDLRYGDDDRRLLRHVSSIDDRFGKLAAQRER